MGKLLENKKKIGFSSILKFVLICFITIIGVLLLRNWYLKSKEIEKETPILSNVLTHQIKSNELYNYIHDADTAIVYMCVSNNEACRNLEKNMKTLIRKNSLEDVIIYLDLKDVSDVSSFFEEVRLHYEQNQKIEEYPVLIYFENASIQDVISKKNMMISDVERFLKGIQLIV